jgi:hypothetical protein
LEDGEDASHDWKVGEMVIRSSGKPCEWNVQLATKNDGPDLVEGSAPSKKEK